MKFVKMTRSDGSPVFFGDGLIIQPALEKMAPAQTVTHIVCSGQSFYVREKIEDVLGAFEGDEGRCHSKSGGA